MGPRLTTVKTGVGKLCCGCKKCTEGCRTGLPVHATMTCRMAAILVVGSADVTPGFKVCASLDHTTGAAGNATWLWCGVDCNMPTWTY